MTTFGKYRHLQQASTLDGHFVVLAIDHRTNLRERLDQFAPQTLTDQQFIDFKLQVMDSLLGHSTAILADPVYGFGPAIQQQVIPSAIGFLSPIEVTDYSIHPSQSDVTYMPNYSVAQVKKLGGCGIKHLLYYHPEAENASEKRESVAKIIEQCQANDIPYYLEPIAYSLDPNVPLTNSELRQIVVESAKTFSAMGVDILKLQFPVNAKPSADESLWRSACQELDAVCSVPWALLSSGVDYATFANQAKIACEAGASGVIVGRAVWAEAVELQAEEREQFLMTTAKDRMAELMQICQDSAQSWQTRTTQPQLSDNWHESV